MITIFYGFEALNDYCYIPERRQKWPVQRMIAIAIADRQRVIQDVGPSHGLFEDRKASKAANTPETKALRYQPREPRWGNRN
jgi:hypothetical protein